MPATVRGEKKRERDGNVQAGIDFDGIGRELTVTSSDSSGAITADWTGSGNSSALAITPSSVSFGSVTVGSDATQSDQAVEFRERDRSRFQALAFPEPG